MNIKNKTLAITAGLLLSASLAAGAQVVVRIGPPPPRPVEVVPAAPHPGWVWQPGFHRWDGAHYVWVPGAYAAPPYAGARWIPGHWANRGGGYVWVEGHWRR
jgi:hypothetical protein